MNDTFNPGGNMNLSGTRGLGLEMDPWAYEARGRSSGRKQGLREGREEGYAEGFDDGMSEGIALGRSKAIIEANKVIEKLNADFSNERIEANRLGVSVNALRRTIEILMEKNPKSVSYIRRVFRDVYEDEVRDWIEGGMISVPPHIDPSVPETSRIKQFIRDAYFNVGK